MSGWEGAGDPSEAGRTWARDGDDKSLQRGGGSGSFAELKRRFREQQSAGRGCARARVGAQGTTMRTAVAGRVAVATVCRQTSWRHSTH